MQESLSSDICILSHQAWAQTSAAGDGRINGDHSVWKRNFRSALRAKGFKMIFDNKNDAANPHKVYQFPSEPHSAGKKTLHLCSLPLRRLIELLNLIFVFSPLQLRGLRALKRLMWVSVSSHLSVFFSSLWHQIRHTHTDLGNLFSIFSSHQNYMWRISLVRQHFIPSLAFVI